MEEGVWADCVTHKCLVLRISDWDKLDKPSPKTRSESYAPIGCQFKPPDSRLTQYLQEQQVWAKRTMWIWRKKEGPTLSLHPIPSSKDLCPQSLAFVLRDILLIASPPWVLKTESVTSCSERASERERERESAGTCNLSFLLLFLLQHDEWNDKRPPQAWNTNASGRCYYI